MAYLHSSDENNHHYNLNIELHLPKTVCDEVYPDDDYLDYFVTWMIRNGCVVMKSEHTALKAFEIKPRKVLDNPEDYLVTLECMFRNDVTCQ